MSPVGAGSRSGSVAADAVPAASVLSLVLAAAVCVLLPSDIEPAENARHGEGGAIEVRRLLAEGHFALAEERAREAIAHAEATDGPESLVVGGLLDLLVESLWRGGKAATPETRELADRALRIKRATLGDDHPGTADSLANLGKLLRQTGRLTEARPFLEQALAIREKALGPEHPAVASILTNLGNLFVDMGLYGDAKPLYERALAITERVRGPDHPDLAPPLKNLADLLVEVGAFSEAQSLFERALRIAEQGLGGAHPQVAGILNGLAALSSLRGDYAAASARFERALAIGEHVLGEGHPFVAGCLNNLALVRRNMGDYAGARRLYERAIEISRRTVGVEHPLTASTLKNLADLLRALGDHVEARSLYETALAIRERTLGPAHPEVAMGLNDLAALLETMGDLEAARHMYERALAIWKASLTPDHPDVALTLSGLATLMADSGDLEGAREKHARALDIRRKAYGAAHPTVALSQRALAGVFRRQGRLTEARSLAENALEIQQTALGSEHPEVAETLCDLGGILADAADFSRTLEVALRSERVSMEHLRLTAASLGERQALAYATARTMCLDLALSVAERDPAAGSWRRAWDALIRSRALVFDEIAARHKGIRESDDPDVARLARDLGSASTRLANLLVRGAGHGSLDQYRTLVDEARREKDRAERALADRSLSYRQRQSAENAGLAEVVENLPAGAALIAFARHQGRPGPSLSIAFIMRKNRGDPILVPLGPAHEIDTLVSRWHQEAARGVARSGWRASESVAAYRAAGEDLRRRIWDPIAHHVVGARLVFVVPDGSLHLLNISALPAGTGEFLVEREAPIHYLSAERDLIAAREGRRDGIGLLALGGPAFDDPRPAVLSGRPLGGAGPPAERQPATAAVAQQAPRGAGPCGDLGSVRFAALPAAAGEASEIAALWRESVPDPARALVIHLTGLQATEAAFREKAAGRRVVHLATHGFFLGGRCASGSDSTRGIGGLADAPVATPTLAGRDSLFLSGLALAGANRRDTAGPLEDDGILTAEEITALDLGGVEWAVLSACNTGIGEVKGGEGLFGLRRSFRIAGAATVITSLWEVEDETARRWMRILYESRLREGRTTADAVWEASRGLLLRRRQGGESTHPFYWAGFVAAGDWR